ncbi:MAG: hypothetical protein CL946_01610 [Ectothiorhodospiraceae bacterium]|nr:hypothetical protein [Ectothiorhodospiraceae bacterium]
MNFKHIFLFLLTAAVLPGISYSQQDWKLTMEEKIQFETPDNAVVSPDGKYVAYTVRKPDLINSEWNTQIYRVEIQSGEIVQMTRSVESCHSPAWSPRGQWLTFLSSRSYLDDELQEQQGTDQLFALPMDGGEAQTWTALELGVNEYKWSPDGTEIALISDGEYPAGSPRNIQVEPRRNVDAISTDDPKREKTIWLLNAENGEIRLLFSGDRGIEQLSWANDGSYLVYQTNYTGEYNDDQKFDIWRMNLDGERTQLTDVPGPETQPSISPTGGTMAFITQTVPDIEFAQTDLVIADTDGTNWRNLTESFDWSVSNYSWLPDESRIIVQVAEGTGDALYSIDPANGTMEAIHDDGTELSNLDVATGSERGAISIVEEGVESLPEIVTDIGGKFDAVTAYTEQLNSFRFGNQRVITVPSRDGKFDIEAVLIEPVGYEKGKKHPLLLAYHGGPYGRFRNTLMQYYPVQMLAQEGVMVVMPNVRGSAGYSDAFGQSNRYDLGGGDYRDAMDVVDYLIAEGMVDSTKMGVMGGSYGGYMTNWTISQTNRFAAAISLYGIYSWFTDWSNSFQPAFEQMYFGYNYWEKPIDANSLWISTAPQTYTASISTPTLILHGTEDRYTNIANSREMYAALNERGVEVEFVTYPRAGHGLRTEPNQYIDAVERTMAWFRKYALRK